MYGNFYSKSIYDEFDYEKLEYIPNENSPYNNTINNEIIDFIFINNIEQSNRKYSYFYLSINSSNLNNIEFIVNSYNYYNGIMPVPNLREIFALDNLENKMEFDFLSQSALMINIFALYGKGELYFNNKLYNLAEKKNKVSLILNSNVDENITFKLQNKIPLINGLPDFVFYIEYYYRNSKINFDKIDLEDISEIIYKKPDYPLFIYSDIKKYEQDINIFFKFNGVDLKNKTNMPISNNNFNISYLITEKLEILGGGLNNSEKLEGVIDLSIGIGQMYIPKEIIKISSFHI